MDARSGNRGQNALPFVQNEDVTAQKSRSVTIIFSMIVGMTPVVIPLPASSFVFETYLTDNHPRQPSLAFV